MLFHQLGLENKPQEAHYISLSKLQLTVRVERPSAIYYFPKWNLMQTTYNSSTTSTPNSGAAASKKLYIEVPFQSLICC